MKEINIFNCQHKGTIYLSLQDHPEYRMAMDIRYFIQKEFNIYITKDSESWLLISYIAIDAINGRYKQGQYDLNKICKGLDNNKMKEIIKEATQRNWNREWIKQGMENYKPKDYHIDINDL